VLVDVASSKRIQEGTMRIIGVAGAGQMGSGIAQVVALAGYEALLYDVAAPQLEKASASIAKFLQRQADKGMIEASTAAAAKARLKTTSSLDDMSGCDFVIEAVPEVAALKVELFRQLDRIVPPGVILASNTSSISITRLAAATDRPDQVIGMHFMNPVPVMKLVEVIRGLTTADETFAVTLELAAKLGKEVAVAQDYPGFIVNRVLIPMINEAIFAHFEGVGSVADIDKAMQLGTNLPMGPFTLADFIGLDTVLAIMNVLHSGYGDAKYRPCPLLVRKVEAGHLGRKSGKGFYDYGQGR
jgi:3-hydroxybutyryl-CoA dehydrogenase